MIKRLAVFFFSLSLATTAWAGFDECMIFKEKDNSTALKEWLPLAEQGDAQAQFNLWETYSYGRGVTKDEVLAVQWYRKAMK